MGMGGWYEPVDCWTPVDDLCQVDNSCGVIPQEAPPENNCGDLFFIQVEVEFWHGLAPEEAGDGGDQEVCKYVGRNVARFWEACPRRDKGNLSRTKVSAILSEAGVPPHKQDVDKVVLGADEVSNSAEYKVSKILPLRVWISLFACPCCHIHNKF